MSFNIITHLFTLNGPKKRLDTECAAAYLCKAENCFLYQHPALPLFKVRASGLSQLLPSSPDTGVTGINGEKLASLLTAQIHISYTLYSQLFGRKEQLEFLLLHNAGGHTPLLEEFTWPSETPTAHPVLVGGCGS